MRIAILYLVDLALAAAIAAGCVTIWGFTFLIEPVSVFF